MGRDRPRREDLDDSRFPHESRTRSPGAPVAALQSLHEQPAHRDVRHESISVGEHDDWLRLFLTFEVVVDHLLNDAKSRCGSRQFDLTFGGIGQAKVGEHVPGAANNCPALFSVSTCHRASCPLSNGTAGVLKWIDHSVSLRWLNSQRLPVRDECSFKVVARPAVNSCKESSDDVLRALSEFERLRQ